MYFPLKFHTRCPEKKSPQDYVRIKRNRVRIIFRKEEPSSSLKVKIPNAKVTKITLYDGTSVQPISPSLPTALSRFSKHPLPGMPLQF